MCDVLILDDDPLVLATLAEALRDDGLDIAEARNSAEAIERLEDDAHPPRLLVTDINLGEAVDGRAVAAAARRRYPGIPVIFITGRPDTLINHPFGTAERLLAKPFRPSELVAAVRAMERRAGS